jgi:hypothetical protein
MFVLVHFAMTVGARAQDIENGVGVVCHSPQQVEQVIILHDETSGRDQSIRSASIVLRRNPHRRIEIAASRLSSSKNPSCPMVTTLRISLSSVRLAQIGNGGYFSRCPTDNKQGEVGPHKLARSASDCYEAEWLSLPLCRVGWRFGLIWIAAVVVAAAETSRQPRRNA